MNDGPRPAAPSLGMHGVLAAPPLDARSRSELLARAVELVPQYAPEWTLTRTDDPGATALAILAHMHEGVLERLNRVPEKVFITFLEILGFELEPPRPSTGVVSFQLVEQKKEPVLVPEGTEVSVSAAGEEGSPRTFETRRALTVTPARLTRCLSLGGGRLGDRGDPSTYGAGGFDPFEAEEPIESLLYVGDDRLVELAHRARVAVLLSFDGEVPDLSSWRWEYFDGEAFVAVEGAEPGAVPERLFGERARLDRAGFGAMVAFEGPLPRLAATTVADRRSCWLRARLDRALAPAAGIGLRRVEVATIAGEEGQAPDDCAVGTAQGFAASVDASVDFPCFGRLPEHNSAFYVRADRALARPGTQVRVSIELSPPSFTPPPNPSDDLEITWEYPAEEGWTRLGVSAFAARGGDLSRAGFSDDTRCFTRDGCVRFARPDDLRTFDVSGVSGRWIRGRITGGGYGLPPRWIHDGQGMRQVDDRPLRAPGIRRIRVSFLEYAVQPAHVLAQESFEIRDLAGALAHHEPARLLAPPPAERASLYLGFDRPPLEHPLSLYVRAAEYDRTPLERSGRADDAEPEDPIAWEFWDGASFAPLPVKDETEGLARSGLVTFLPALLDRRLRLAGHDLHWIRARPLGPACRPRRVADIVLNAVDVTAARTYRDEVLGASDGTADQTFSFEGVPVLAGEEIFIQEPVRPAARELSRLAQELGTVPDAVALPDARGDLWVRWRGVESFAESGPESRHYTVGRLEGKLRLGDGFRGMIPPPGCEIQARRYQAGGGADGNVRTGAIEYLSRSIPYVRTVTNPYPTEGGTETERLEALLRRAPKLLRCRDRAVTAEDYEVLARDALPEAARTICVPSMEGQVVLAVLPREGRDEDGRPVASGETIREVTRFLRARMPPQVALSVRSVRLRDVVVEVEAALSPSARSREEAIREVREKLRRFLDPQKGGKAGTGWPFGGTVRAQELLALAEGVSGVTRIESVALHEPARPRAAREVLLAPDELPHVLAVRVLDVAT